MTMRKKAFSIIGIALILQFLVCSLVNAEGQTRLWFEENHKGSVYTVSVNLNGEKNIEMLQFCIGFDDKKLELLSIAPGEAFKNVAAPTLSNNNPGKIYVIWDALSPIDNGALIFMQFKVRDGASGRATVSIETDFETIFADGDYNDIDVSLENLDIILEDTKQEEEKETKPYNPDPGKQDEEHTIIVQKGDEIKLPVIPKESEVIQYISSNESAVTIENGQATAVEEGFAQVTVVDTEAETEETFYVTVLNEEDYQNYEQNQGQKKTLNVLVICAIALVAVIAILFFIIRNKKK